MSEAMDKITAHWRQLAGELRNIEVPEWEMTIHYRPANMRERGRIETALEDEGEHAAAVVALIVLARDEKGERLFHDADAVELMRKADPTVIARVAAALLAGPSPEDVEKN